ncbi:MAG TPA: iron chelate uptake ABC transporter family permease subunit [Dehalococcoidia bacterium]|nr:iron chelate uptake ABC transporter family permease subunit [Dehalococcoidia bacterium]
MLADLFARTVALPREIPLGVVTALAGGPFFLWLLDRTRQEHGGWG